MNEDVTQAELARRFDSLERRQRDFVSKELYERDMSELKTDIAEIRESQKWSARLIIAQFVTLVVALVIIAVNGGIPA